MLAAADRVGFEVQQAEETGSGQRRRALALWHDTTCRLATIVFPLAVLLLLTARGIIVTLFTDFPTAPIVYLIFLIFYQQLENNVLQPFIFKRTVNVPPLAVIVAILAGSAVLGVVGALLAIPIAAAVQIVVKEYLGGQTTVSGTVILPDDPPPPDEQPPPPPPPPPMSPGRRPEPA